MAPLRLALAVPRFWPLMGDGPAHWLGLAESLAEAGHAVSVVTPQWKRTWPQKMTIGRVALVRLRGSGRGGWSTLRWMYSLARWLGEQRDLGGVLVAGLRHEAYVTLGAAAKTPFPDVLLAGDGDLAWQRSAAFGSRIQGRCIAAQSIASQSIVAPNTTLADELAQGGYSPAAIRVIPRRVPILPPSSAKARDAARAALAAVNYDLATTSTAPVALAIGRLDEQHRFGDLVRAWRIVAARRSEARLWIVGDGPERERLFGQINDLDQRFRVLIPGAFDCLDELLAAANVLLVPGQHAVPPLAMLQALATGLPTIAAASPALRECLVPNQTGWLYPGGDFKAIAELVQQAFEQPGKAIALGSAARAQAQTLPTPADEAAEYVSLIRGFREGRASS
jgi:glycosyltransferase involved in cell wall biosynthesis